VARHVVFSAETAAGAKKFERMTGLEFSHCPPFIDTMVLESEARTPQSGSITVGWLGDPRREKGAALLPAIVESARKSPNGQRIKFLFQCTGKNKRWLDEVNSQLNKFDVAVERISAGATRQVYWQAFQRCDIILIPYDAKLYPPERGSGIAIEALLTGKPIVTTPGTFAATLVTPGTGVIASDAESLAAGILDIAAHYDAFQTAARQRSEELLPSYNPISILRQLTRQNNDGPSPATLE
jgi:glycosyltransferase involved in cell wall biosynthesis